MDLQTQEEESQLKVRLIDCFMDKKSVHWYSIVVYVAHRLIIYTRKAHHQCAEDSPGSFKADIDTDRFTMADRPWFRRKTIIILRICSPTVPVMSLCCHCNNSGHSRNCCCKKQGDFALAASRVGRVHAKINRCQVNPARMSQRWANLQILVPKFIVKLTPFPWEPILSWHSILTVPQSSIFHHLNSLTQPTSDGAIWMGVPTLTSLTKLMREPYTGAIVFWCP